MRRLYSYLDHTMLTLVAICGYVAGPRWFVVLTAAGLWIDEAAKLSQRLLAGEAISSKATTYALTGALANFTYAACLYLAGMLARTVL